MARRTIEIIGVLGTLIAGFVWLDSNADQRFEDARGANDAAHARIENSISELCADFRAVVPRAAAERKPFEEPPTR